MAHGAGDDPAIVPFLLITDRFVAARVSNGLVLLTLFAVGFGFARLVHTNPLMLGWSTALFGLAMVVIVVRWAVSVIPAGTDT